MHNFHKIVDDRVIFDKDKTKHIPSTIDNFYIDAKRITLP